ncbi:MAG: tetratricopeptide repeat protein [Hyphomicrobiales bacterium]|nr:tetratricopeptide repeat protein [Hyphomicrobiales bacterium]
MERRLAAIFAADMVGYSRLMEADETGTLHRQRIHRAELIDPTIEKYNGRIIKLMGDGMLVEFASVVDAVQCAVSIQRVMVGREEDVEEDRRIQYRIGINLGDIVFEEGDIFGHGVNVAARLEAMAAPGGVVISGTAHDMLSSNVEVGYEALGEVQVKNIAEPVRAFRVMLDEGAVPASITPPRRRTFRIPHIVALAVVAILAVVGAWWFSLTDHVPADPTRLVYPLPDKPSLAVLPFDNMTSDEGNRYLADGFVETLITELSKLPDLFVIARSSSFLFRGKNLPIGQISEALGVRYIVEGSFQRRGDDLRVNVQLIDAIAGNHVWSGQYDRSAGEFFMLQDDLIVDLTNEIGGRGSGGIFLAERRRVEKLSNSDLSIIELWEKATEVFFRYNREGNDRTAEIAQEIIDRSPDHPRGYVAMGWHHLGRIWLGYSPSFPQDIKECSKLTDRAIALDVLDYMGHLLRGYCYSVAGSSAEAAAAMRRAYELNPNDVIVQNEYAKLVLVREGRYEDAIKIFERLLRLSPGQQIGTNRDIGRLYFALGDYSRAIEFGEKETQSGIAQGLLAASYWMVEKPDESRKAVLGILERFPDYKISNSLAAVSWLPEEARERYAAALIAAGMPE